MSAKENDLEINMGHLASIVSLALLAGGICSPMASVRFFQDVTCRENCAELLALCQTAQPGAPDGQKSADPPQKDPQEAQKDNKEAKSDPFADLDETSKQQATPEGSTHTWMQKLFTENLGFREEVMSQFDATEDGQPASRQSIGFEVLKKFSDTTATIASFDFQGRLVRRDGFNPVLNDMEGQNERGWAFEYANLYLDLYNVFNPVLSARKRRENVGRFNLRAGHFYVPFGINLQTDTHGTVLQLSNERNFGFEQDWYAGFWGALNNDLNYDAYYLTGSGYDLKFKGQTGLGAIRLSLSNKYSSRYGMEGGLSILGGERLSSEAILGNPYVFQAESSPNVAVATGSPNRVKTERIGLDGRYRRAVPTGLLTFTSEVSGGGDDGEAVFMQLYQAEYLRASRRWGLATQYRRFQQDGLGADASLIGEVSWYFRNDVGNSNLHWIKLNVERHVERMQGSPRLVITLQYYFYR